MVALVIVTLVVTSIVVGAVAVVYVKTTGLRARPAPGSLETSVARAVRSLAVPGATRGRANPVPASAATMESAMAHFADHCATCHANDGSGSAEIGQGLFPKPPDMRAQATQALTDGELFWIIENGVRFTGMPAFGTGDASGEEASWALVHFIRRLPTLSRDDVARMEKMNPRSPEEIRQEIEDEQFLQGGTVAPPAPDHASHTSHGGEHR